MSSRCHAVRNLFDQYQEPENRLSHALAVCLHEDRSLLEEFLEWISVRPPVSARQLRIAEQGLPGDPPDSEEEAERRGLPDIVIHDDASWCVLIESKVQSRLTEDQLDRHERTCSYKIRCHCSARDLHHVVSTLCVARTAEH